jgi:hypothetical protein
MPYTAWPEPIRIQTPQRSKLKAERDKSKIAPLVPPFLEATSGAICVAGIGSWTLKGRYLRVLWIVARICSSTAAAP